MRKVITYGTFDLLHEGHIKLLRRAKALGDYLIVGVTSENYDRYRGKLNVKQTLTERMENIRAAELADQVIVEEYEGQKIDDIVKMGVDVFAIGSDWIGRFDYLREYCEVVYLERTKGISSTALRDRQRPLIRFGIVGSGYIADRFVMESKFVSGVTMEGVYNPHGDSARDFCQEHELSFFCDDYRKLLEQVNAVYIASPYDTHYSCTREALLAGKHVLCETPMAMTEGEARELFALAKKQGGILMEAIKTAYCPGFQRLISCAKSGRIGRIISVDATITKLENPRARNVGGMGGSMTELAAYPLLAILKLLGYGFQNIHFTSYSEGRDLFSRVDLWYPNAMATAKVGLGVKSEGSLVISGTRGYVYVPAPWWETEYFELRYENPGDVEKHFYKFSGDGLRYEIVEFLDRIAAGEMRESVCGLSCGIAGILERYHSDPGITLVKNQNETQVSKEAGTTCDMQL